MKRNNVPKHIFLYCKKSKCNNEIVTKKLVIKAKVMISHTEASFETKRNDVYVSNDYLYIPNQIQLITHQ